MFDHFGVPVYDYQASKAFYTAALAALGLKPLKTFDKRDKPGEEMCVGYGRDVPQFWLYAVDSKPNAINHVAFACDSRADVDAFYDAALKAGGTCNGPAGPRDHYMPNYYAAFVLDADGHNIEAVCRAPA